jgi:hypothetical protein
MKKRTTALCSLVFALLLLAAWSSAAAAPGVSIRVRPLPKNKPLELAVGESVTFEIQIKSSEPFLLAMAHTDQYYPGRGIFWQGIDRQSRGAEATLYLTMTGKDATADLPAVCDWPEPGDCWPEGVAPVDVAAGVRFGGGQIYGEHFPFAVVVP